jgi:hypothetical protein
VCSGLDYNVNALVVSGSGRLFVGGVFQYFNVKSTTRFGHVGAFDPADQSWDTLDGGLTGVVLVLAFQGDVLFAGGQFISTAAKVAAHHVARFEGGVWAALPVSGSAAEGVSDHVHALTPFGSRMVIGGQFATLTDGTEVGGLAAFSVAGGLEGLGMGVSTGENRNLVWYGAYALLAVDSLLLVGGSFVRAGNRNASNVAVWNGADFYPLGADSSGVFDVGSGVLDGQECVKAFVAHGEYLHIIGGFQYAVCGASSFDSHRITRYPLALLANPAAETCGFTPLVSCAPHEGMAAEIFDAINVGTGLLLGGRFHSAEGESATLNRVALWPLP